jgi:hypothetical protein
MIKCKAEQLGAARKVSSMNNTIFYSPKKLRTMEIAKNIFFRNYLFSYCNRIS